MTRLGPLGFVGNKGGRDGAVNFDGGDLVDYFKFTLSSARRVGVALHNHSFDVDLFVEDSSAPLSQEGTVIASSENKGNRMELLNANLAAGTYYVRVQAHAGTEDSYSLLLATAPPRDDPVSDFSTSASVVVDGELAGSIRPYWDIDWIEVELEACGVYVLEVQARGAGVGSLMDPELVGVFVDPTDSAVHEAYDIADRLASKGGGRIHGAHDYDGGTGNDASLTFTAAATGSHYIKIVSQGGFAGTYNVVVTTDVPAPPIEECTSGTVAVADGDSPGLVLADDELGIDEGGSGMFTVALATVPTGEVTVAVSSADAGAVSVSPTSLMFSASNWGTPQTVAVTGVEDDDTADETVTVTAAASGGGYDTADDETVTVAVTDGDSPGLVLSPSSLTVVEGSTATFTVQLETIPTGEVTVAVSSDDTAAATVSPTSLAFTASNWNAAQSVTVTGVHDSDTDHETVAVTAAASGGGYDTADDETVTVAVTDGDSPGLVLSSSSLTVVEGSTATFTVQLETIPTGEVTVAVSSDDTAAATVSPTSLAFTASNWNSTQSVTVTGVHDSDTDHETVAVTAAASGGGYDTADDETVAVAVTDDDSPGLVLSHSSLTVDEDGSDTFTVALATQPTAAVTVAVSSDDTAAATVSPTSLAFTASNWNSTQSVTVTGVHDSDTDHETVAVTAAASGGGYDTADDETVAVAVTDDDSPGLVLSHSSLTVVEGSTATFTVQLETIPTGEVTVAVSSADAGAVSVSPTSLMFSASNWGTPQTVAVTGVEDDDTADETVAVTAAASGGGYDTADDETVTVAVTDGDSPGLVLSPSSLTVVEGSTATFTVQLETIPTGEVTVAVSSDDTAAVSVSPTSLMFSASNWGTPQTVAVTGVEDDDTADETVAVTAAASGGGYDTADDETVTVAVTDGDSPGLVLSPSSLTVVEGSTATFTVQLETIPTGEVTVAVSSDDTAAATVSPTSLAFTASNWNAAQSVTVTGVHDSDTDHETVAVTAAASGGGYDTADDETVAVAVTDDDSPGLVLSHSSLTVDEGSTATFTVQLETIPTGEVTVAVSSDDTAAATVSPTSLAFTASNWNAAQSVTVTGVHDSDTDHETVTVTAAASGGGYDTADDETVAVAVTDDDSPGLVLSHSSLTVDEDGSDTFTVALATQPTAAVTVAVSSDDTAAATVSPTSLAFTASNWNSTQSVTVTGVHDSDTDHETVAVTAAASGGGYDTADDETVAVAVTDDDSPGLVLSHSSLTVVEGSTATFTVQLETIPTGEVTVAVSSDDTAAATVSPTSLAFTASNWNSTQSVTVTGVHDSDTDHETVAVTAAASGGGYDTADDETVTVAVTDDDSPGLVLSHSSLTVDEDGSDTFTVALATQPTAAVTVAVSSDDTAAATVSPTSLAFTASNWNSTQSVTVTGVHDSDTDHETVAVTAAASGGGYDTADDETVTVAVTDDDSPGLVLSPSSLTVDEDGSDTFTVALATQPTAAVTVAVSSDDTAAATVSPTSLAFTASNWNSTQSVTVTGVHDSDTDHETVTVTAAASGGGYDTADDETVTVAVTDDDSPGLVLSPSSLDIDEGDTGTFNVWLDTEPDQQVIVSVSSGDSGAATVSPASLTFTVSDWSTVHTVTVAGAGDADAADESLTVTANATGGDYTGKTAAVTVTVDDDETAAVKIAPVSRRIAEHDSTTFEASLTSRPTQQVIVSVVSGDTGAATVSPASLTFTVSDWSTVQTVTVAGAGDADAADESVTVTANAAGGDYTGKTAAVAVTVDDDETAVLVVDRSSLQVSEDGSGSFSVKLSSQPSASVTVSVSSRDAAVVRVPSRTHTFSTSNWNIWQQTTVTAAADDDTDDESATVGVSSSSADGDYHGLTGSLVVTVVDDDEPALLVESDSVRLHESGTAAFSVKLATQPAQPVRVALSSDDTGAATVSAGTLTFTRSNWQRGQQVTVTGVGDSDDANESLTVTASAAGGDYRGESAEVSVAVVDDDSPNLLVAPGSLLVDEGAAASLTVALATQPAHTVTVALGSDDTGAATVSPATLTFTASTWDTAQTVAVTGTNDDDASDEEVTLTASAAGSPDPDYADKRASVTVLVDDDDPAALVADPVALSVGEFGSATFAVELATQPAQTVTVALSSDDTGAATVSPATLTFTASTWDTAQTVAVTGTNDSDASDESVTLTAEASGGGYDGVVAQVPVEVDDNDTPALEIDPRSRQVEVGEGGSGSFSVRLATRPTAPVTVRVTSGDSGAVSEPRQLDFSVGNWTVYQQLAVVGLDDDDASDESVTLTVTAYGGDYEALTTTVTTTVVDDDEPAIVFEPDEFPAPDDGVTTVSLRLDTRPTAQVTVTLVSNDTGVATVSPTTLTFTTSNWDTAQDVDVTGKPSAGIDDVAVTITATAAGGDYQAVTAEATALVANTGLANLRMSPRSLSIDENGTGAVRVRLTIEPTVPVRVSLSSDDVGAGTVSPSVLTFGPGDWNTWQHATVTGVHDDDSRDESSKITAVASGGAFDGASNLTALTVLDDDEPALAVDPDSLAVDEDGSAGFTVRLTTEPSGTVKVSASSDDTDAATVPSADLWFTAADWNIAQPVAVSGVDDDDDDDEQLLVTLSASGADYRNVTATVDVTVVDTNATPRFTSPNTAAVDENTMASAFSHELVIVDANPQDQATSFAGLTGGDRNLFSVETGNAGNFLKFTGADFTLDHEDTDSYEVTVTATTGDGTRRRSVSQTITVSVNDLNEPPRFISRDTVRVSEAGALRHHLLAEDEDSSDTALVFAVTGGTDRDGFQITSQNLLSFADGVALDFETKDTYVVQVSVTSGVNSRALTAAQTITVTLIDANEPPVFDPQDVVELPEHTSSLGFSLDLMAEDPDAGDETATFSVRPGPAADLFAVRISGGVSQLVFADPEIIFDYELRSEYRVEVAAATGLGDRERTATDYVTVRITDENDPPSFTTPDSTSIVENTSLSYVVAASDQDGHTVTFSISGGADMSTFAIVSATGVLTSLSGVHFDYESGKIAYEVVLTATDSQGASTDQTFTLHIADESTAVPLAPQNLTVVEENLTSISLDWDPPANDDDAGYDGYRTETTSQPPPGDTIADPSPSRSDTSSTQTGLSAATQYEILVQARYGANQRSAASNAVVAWTDDCAASRSTECEVSAHDSTTGRVNTQTAGDADWYKVALFPGAVYDISVKGSEASDSGGTLADPEVRIHDAMGTAIIGAADSDSGAGENALVESFAAENSVRYVDYFVEVSGDDSVGTYTLSVLDNLEDLCDAATTTVCETTVAGTALGRLETAADIDWFAVELEAGQTYDIKIQSGDIDRGIVDPALGDLAAPVVQMHDPSGIAVPRHHADVDDSLIELFTPTASGTYYVAVSGGAGTGAFTVLVTGRANVIGQLGSGELHACVRWVDQTVECWGSASYERLAVPDEKFIWLAVGDSFACGITRAGGAACWGDRFNLNVPPPSYTTPPELTGAVAVEAGYQHACALHDDGSVTCWGRDLDGRLMPPALLAFSSLSLGMFNACAIVAADRALRCWGSDAFGETMPPTGEFLAVNGGQDHTCGVRFDQTVECWGRAVAYKDAPMEAFTAVSASSDNTCGLRTDGTVQCWGRNLFDLNRAPTDSVAELGRPLGQQQCVIVADRLGVACWGKNAEVTDGVPTRFAADVFYPGPPNTAPFFLDGESLDLFLAEDAVLERRVRAVEDDPLDRIRMYEIAGGADADSFEIGQQSGVLSFADGVTIDYESGKTVYTVVLRVTSGDEITEFGSRVLTDEIIVTVYVTDANDAPVFTSPDSRAEFENTQHSWLHHLNAFDDDPEDTAIVYGIGSGGDTSDFAVTPDGALTWASADPWDYESDKTVYTVEVEVITGAGERELLTTQTITIYIVNVAETPTAPLMLAVSQARAFSVLIGWAEPEYVGVPLDDYDVQYREVGAAAWIDVAHSDTSTSAEITALTPDTTYEFRVRASNVDGDGPWTPALEATTLTADLLTTPGSVSVVEGGTGTFDVTLSAQPTGTVTVTVTSDDAAAATVAPVTLMFTTTTWNTAQTVTVTGVVDVDAADEQVAVTLDADGGGFGDATAEVAVTVDDGGG